MSHPCAGGRGGVGERSLNLGLCGSLIRKGPVRPCTSVLNARRIVTVSLSPSPRFRGYEPLGHPGRRRWEREGPAAEHWQPGGQEGAALRTRALHWEGLSRWQLERWGLGRRLRE